MQSAKPYVIAIEEHYADPAVTARATTDGAGRVAAFAALAPRDAEAAADELERTVTRLGFKGAMIHGRTQDEFHDLEKFWPIYERAQYLAVPIYIHPGPPHPAVQQAYYAD